MADPQDQPGVPGREPPSDPTATMDEFGPPPPIADPERLGRFRIVRRVGQGAMGVVYEAIDESRGQRVAIKAMHRLGPERVYRFKREFRALTGVRHRNVVALHELVSDRDQLFFTMELVEGTDFITALCGPLVSGRRHAPCRDLARLRKVLRELADGIHAIHGAGILHRDIKPSNVLVTPEDRVVLLDFGLVREHGVEDQIGVTADGALLGTPMYMAPEQALGIDVGPATDWYAFAELLYHALTGEPPFANLGMLAMLAAKRDSLPAAPSTITDGIPPDLEALCTELLVSEPGGRPTGEAIVARLGAAASPAAGASRVVDAFFGRTRELGVLREAYAEAKRRPVLVLLEGPSGIGKTSLARHLCAEAIAADDAIVLSGHCSERESIPYKALDAVMDTLALRLGVHADPRQVEAFLPRDVRSIARLFPVLRGVPAIALACRLREEEDEIEPVTARRRAIAALGEMLARLADRRRLIVRIDDFQWADHDSAVLLGGVLRQVDPAAMLVLLTVRDGAARDGTPLQRLLTELAERDHPLSIQRLGIGPLPADEAELLATQLLGPRTMSRARSLARDIVLEANGSPFFVGELVRYAQLLDSTDGLALDESSVRLDNVIRGRLARLPTNVRSVLEVAAVAGGRTTQRIALAVAGAAVDPGAVRSLVDDRLVRLHGAELDDVLEIDHDRIRETVLECIAPVDVTRIHLAIARALDAAGIADEPALAHHFRAAGEFRLAHDHTLAAAEQAAAALAFDRAAALYHVALSLDVLAPGEYADVEAKMADALANAGRIPEAARAYRRAAAHCGPMAIEWRRRAAEHLLASGHTDEGRAALEEVLRCVGLSLPSSTVRTLGSLLLDRARLAIGGLEVRTGAEVTPQALQRLDVCWTASRGLIYTDGLAGAAFHAQHLRLALRCGEPVRIARALAVEGHMSVALGADPKRAAGEALIARAQTIAESVDSHYARGMIAECAGHVAIAVGDWQGCFERLEQAIAIFRGHCTGVAHEIGICRAHGALCLQFMGCVVELRERAYALLEENRDRPNPYVTGFARGILGNIALLAPDRVEEAAEQLAIYQRDAPRRFQGQRVNYVCQRAALERYRGRADRAWDMGEADAPAIAKLAVLRSPQVDAEVQLWRAQNVLAGATIVADPRTRTVHAARPIAALLAHPSSHAQAYGHLSQASVDALHGDALAAAAGLRRAIALFGRHRMLAFEACAQRRLAALVGGDVGRELLAHSDASMAQMEVVRPDRITDMMTPGFARA